MSCALMPAPFPDVMAALGEPTSRVGGGVLLGTNLKGYTLIASVGIANGVWIEGRWYSATAIAGPVYKNDDFQFDLNVKF